MKRIFLLTGLTALFISCKLQPDSTRNYDKYDENKVYRLRLNPVAGSVYKYELSNETEINIEAEAKEVHTVNKSEVELNYSVGIDSSDNYVFTTTYNKIKLYTKAGDTETQADANNAMVSIDPVEKMLGILKSAKIVATVNKKGEQVAVAGYKELENKLMAYFSDEDHYAKEMARAQWEKVVGDGIVKNTLDQLFKIFPDSAIHLGDTWKLNSNLGGELPMNIKSIYVLKAINNDIAIISSKGTVTSDMRSNSVMGYSGVTANLSGVQEGEFEIETRTGMLMNGTVKVTVEGTLNVTGQQIPIGINSKVKIHGVKEK